MATTKAEDVDFPVEQAAESLFNKLAHVTAAKRNPSQPLWELGWVAFEHIAMHKAGDCTAQPCLAYGVSCALFICCDYLRERDGFLPFVQYAALVERLESTLRDCVDELSRGLEPIAEASARLHQQERAASSICAAHAHELMCERPQRLTELAKNLLDALGLMASELRQKSTVPAFALERRAGRAPKLMLKAIRQHLAKDGGLELGEIARLVPDGGDPTYARQKDRVRKDVDEIDRGGDVRWDFYLNEPGKLVAPVDSAESTGRPIVPH